MTSPLGQLAREWKGTIAIVFLFVTLSALLFWLESYRAYQTELTLLVVEKEAGAPEGIAANLAQLAATDTFARRTQAELALLAPLEEYRRSSVIGGELKVTEQTGTDVLRLTAEDVSSEYSRHLAHAGARALLGMTAQYYNIRTQVDVRIVDGPVTRRVVDRPMVYALMSLVTGFLATSAFFALLAGAPLLVKYARRRGPVPVTFHKEAFSTPEKSVAEAPLQSYREGDTVPFIDPRKFVPTKPRSLSFESFEAKPQASSPQPTTKAAAPDNLPIGPADARFLGVIVPSGFEDTESAPASEPAPSAEAVGPAVPDTSEPTPEEYKRRLNALLSEE